MREERIREWRRVPRVTICNGCGLHIPAESPALFWKLPKVTRVFIRCQVCEGPAPPDLPERPVPARFTKAMQPIAAAVPRELKRSTVERPRYGEDR